MKTPLEILLQRHRASESKLDEIRRNIVSQEFRTADEPAEARNSRRPASGLAANFWREVIWRSRLAWIGMAALWVALWMVNRQMEPGSGMMVSARSRPTAEAVRDFEEQRQLLAELLQPAVPVPAELPRPRPGPRSEIRTALRAG